MNTMSTTAPSVSLSSLQYLLNETIAHSIRSTLDRSNGTGAGPTFVAGRVDFLGDVEAVTAASTVSGISTIGFNVGFKAAQLLLLDPGASTKLSNTALVDNPLEAMKFICRDVWKSMFGRQMDNLRTNHLGTFVLVDHRPVAYANCHYMGVVPSGSRLPQGTTPTSARAPPYVEFNAALIHGVLECLGISVVRVDAKPSASDDGSSGDNGNGVVYTVETKNI